MEQAGLEAERDVAALVGTVDLSGLAIALTLVPEGRPADPRLDPVGDADADQRIRDQHRVGAAVGLAVERPVDDAGLDRHLAAINDAGGRIEPRPFGTIAALRHGRRRDDRQGDARRRGDPPHVSRTQVGA